ncbi:MAG: respiratory nitrate reductase, gamma subunit [Firmicutes bacterium]|nr:respiratory nitrate reductase, gamma subunit [Bacillota bacterium]
MEQFLWVILPYITLIFFFAGLVHRYKYDQFGWTTKSSEIFEKKQLRIGAPVFHFGLLMVLGGHIMGVLVPISIWDTFGVTEEMYHMNALMGGIPAGLAVVCGLSILIYRRYANEKIRLNTSKSEVITLVFLAFVVFSGYLSTICNIQNNGFDYRTTIGPWFRSLFFFSPDAALMTTIPWWFKLHMISWMGLIAVLPFTKLVHMLSLPFRYYGRNYIIYRKRG